MSKSLFDDSALKINRAHEHIKEIESSLVSWEKLKPYKVFFKGDPKSGQNTVSVAVVNSMPKDIALVIGDAIHNLRSALDLAAYEIALRADVSRTLRDKIYFPFEGDRESLKGSRKFRAIESVSQKAANIILNTIEPYKGGNDTLWALNKINNIDKHRLLIPHAQAVSILVEGIKDGQEILMSLKFNTSGKIRGKTIWIPKEVEVKGYREPVFDIFFEDGTPVGGQRVVNTLVMMAVEVSKALAHLGYAEP